MGSDIQAGPELDAMRSQAYKLYARWQAEWARANDGGWTSAGEWYADLMQHSAHQHDTIIETHDHWLLTLGPSIGDEAGTWTLYVCVGRFWPTGIITGMERPGWRVQAIWQVFDTVPSAIYELTEEMVPGAKRSTPKDVWYNLPEGVTCPR